MSGDNGDTRRVASPTMLRAITVERYRCFVAPATLELRPLTLLFGKNSVGKSALLRTLPLVAASCAKSAANRSGPLALEHPAAMGARYAEIRTNLVARNDLGIKLLWDGRGVREVEIGLRDMTDLGPSRQVVSRLTAREHASRDVLHAELDDTGALCIAREGVKPAALELAGVCPQPSPSLPSDMRDVVAQCEELMRSFSSSVDWLGPVRTQPPRSRVPRIENARLGPLGEGVTEVLAQPDATHLLARVSDATAAIFGSAIEIAEEVGEVSLAMRAGAHRTHLLDVGGGVTQVLPALVRLAEVELGRSAGRILALEQPEAHLHPAAEVELAKIIVGTIAAQSTATDRPLVVIETHSENLLLSLQLAVLEGRLAPDDVLLYWFEQLDDGSVVVRAIHIDADGRPDPPLPPGVFSEDLEIARKILRSRSRRRA
jgi:hypothetical protein